MAVELPEGWQLLPPGWIAIPGDPSEDELTVAQGTFLDMGWDAVACFAARVGALIRCTRGRYARAIAAFPEGASVDPRFAAAHYLDGRDLLPEGPACVKGESHG